MSGARRVSRRQPQNTGQSSQQAEKTTTPQASPKIFPIQFVDVVLYDMNINRNLDNMSEDQVVSVAINIEMASPVIQESRMEVAMKLAINIPTQESPLFAIKITLNGVFMLTNTDKSSMNELAAEFAQTTAPSLMWPYARELLQNLSLRMRIPPLILPTLDLRNGQQEIEALTTSEPTKQATS